jgi:hypothetical protein
VASRCGRDRSARQRKYRGVSDGRSGDRPRPNRSPRVELGAVGDAHQVAVPRGLEVQTPKPDLESGQEGSELPMEYLCPLYLVRITIVVAVGKQFLSARPPTLHDNCRGSLSPAVNLCRSCVGLGWLAQKTTGVYTGSGLRGVIPYVQCVAIGFTSQVCSQSGLQVSGEREFVPKSRAVVYDHVKV